METEARAAKNELFQELKPHCIELSQLALRDDGSAENNKSLVSSTNKLLQVLKKVSRRSDHVFDEKLADYVFFPISQILRKKKIYTDNLSELAIRCVKILLGHGWRRSIALELAKQLLVLLTFVAGGVPGQKSSTPPEELVIEAYECLAYLFRDLSHTPGGSACLTEAGTVPALGHCLTVLLDGVVEGPSSEAQTEALLAVDAIWSCLKDPEALSGFLPGTISALTKCLMPTTSSRRSRKTLITGLGVLKHVLVTILSDIQTRRIRNTQTQEQEPPSSSTEQKTLTKSWLKATSSQIKLALSNVIRLRTHESEDVQSALNKLCLTVLDECHDTLADSSTMLVEACMSLSGTVSDQANSETTTLADLALIHPDLGEMIKNTAYNWVTSLPRIMQANDEGPKRIALRNLANAHRLLTNLGLQSSILEDALTNSLRDSVTATLDVSSPAKAIQAEEFDLNSQAALTLASDNTSSIEFSPLIMYQESQKQTRSQLLQLLETLGTKEQQINMASVMLDYVRGASGPGLMSAFWLSLQLSRSVGLRTKDLEEFFDSSLTLSDEQETLEDELLSYSVSILSESGDDAPDWRLQAIALEVVSYSAQKLQERFRTELVDTLYPIAQLLGSPNLRLREHAIIALNNISWSCGYSSSSAMIVDNVDYMVNAISLRLNTFDISPQAPQVLVMMMRLTGPSLLPYLDDVVSSIFAALDNFHGYDRLVEILFSVLGEIVEVGSTSPLLQIEGTTTEIDHRKKGLPVPDLETMIAALNKKKQLQEQVKHTDDDDETPYKPGSFPHQPWKDAHTLLNEAETQATPEDTDTETPSQDLDPEPTPPPPTKTYTMLQSIALLTQHYLTHPSPHLRIRLLNLLTRSSIALSPNPTAFLPLLNDIWPVIVPFLHPHNHNRNHNHQHTNETETGTEPYILIAACTTLSTLCRCAGDFLSTRIQDEWPSLLKLARSTRTRMQAEKKRGRGSMGENHRIWEALVNLLGAVAMYVRVSEEVVDEMVEVLGEEVFGDWEDGDGEGGKEGKGKRGELREVLERLNPDAVWLAMEEMRRERRRAEEEGGKKGRLVGVSE